MKLFQKKQKAISGGETTENLQNQTMHYMWSTTKQKVFRREQVEAQKEYECSMMRDIDDEQYIDSTFLWYMFRRACGKNNNQAISPIKNENDELINDIHGIVNEWMVYNNKLLNSQESTEEYIVFHDKVDKEVETVYKKWTSDIENLKNILVTEDEIKELNKDLPLGKASGYVGIDTKHIKYGGKMMVMIITKLFNRALEKSHFPQRF